MLQEVLAYFDVKPGGKYIDCTLGNGGHALEILRSGGRVLGLDVDKNSLQRAQGNIKKAGLQKNFVGMLGNFRNIDNIAKEHNFGEVAGILYDLGYTSTQLDDPLGLSFLQDAPLDMRLDRSLGVTAADLLNSLSEMELTRLFGDYSGERLAKRFAKAIVQRRSLKKFRTTRDLSDLLVEVAPPGYEHGRIHPATRTFQALRIAVNDDLTNLEKSLPRAARLLLPGGLMICITFHSLEDRVVKEFGRSARPLLKVVTKTPVTPSKEELARNIRSRSAKLRVFKKII